jgi:23S rRNA (adenine2030-N6)-methyltransferase
MTGSGLFIINPPWTLPQTLEDCLPWLSATLGAGGQGHFTLDWQIQ